MKRKKLIIEKFYKDNGGMSIVTVIVAIGMVLLMVNILLLTSTVNFKMRNMNVLSKDSFYSAEQVLDEIEIGLQQLVSDGLSQAYMEVLTKYDTSKMTSAMKNEEIKLRFYQYLEKKLAVPDNPGKYIAMPQTLYTSHHLAEADDVPEGLFALVKTSTRYHLYSDEKTEVENSYGAFLRTAPLSDGSPDYVTITDESGTPQYYYTGDMIESDRDGLRLKNLIIYYKDPNGFVSTIKTDIRLVYPEFTFANTTMPDIGSYTLITDTGIEQKNSGKKRNDAKTTTIKGNSFAYMVDAAGVKFDYATTKTGENVHVVYDQYKVVNGGITSHDKTKLWAGNILARSSDISLSGRTYVKNDLNLQGRDCKVDLLGYYYGYGDGGLVPGNTGSADSSSAILINGVNTTVNFENVKGLYLAGRAYISLDGPADGADPAPEIGSGKNKVYLGESLAAKSDQLIYLVPPECIGVRKLSEDGTVGDSYYNKNPLTTSEYEYLRSHPDDFIMIAENVRISKLPGSKTLKDFVGESGGVQWYIPPAAPGSESLVYCYMKFESPEKADEFFLSYYEENKEAVNRNTDKYIKSITLPLDQTDGVGNDTNNLGVASGSLPSDNDIEAGTRNVFEYSDGGTLVSRTRSERKMQSVELYENDGTNYENMRLAYGMKLSDDYEAIMASSTPDAPIVTRDADNDGTDDHEAIFRNLIDEEKFKDINGSFEGKDCNALLIHQSSAYSLSAAELKKYNLIIADCDLNIPSGVFFKDKDGNNTSFDGTIIAKGKITITGGGDITFSANSKKVDACMFLTKETDDGDVSVSEVFRDSMELTSLSDDVSTDVSIEDLVMFENWTKNVEIK
ncbi:MAG: hypothetical protein K5888_03480 [Lachnospiraceae bacterium]|nr:hypothetical protein [Lachnospiraceae bacterium]